MDKQSTLIKPMRLQSVVSCAAHNLARKLRAVEEAAK